MTTRSGSKQPTPSAPTDPTMVIVTAGVGQCYHALTYQQVGHKRLAATRCGISAAWQAFFIRPLAELPARYRPCRRCYPRGK